MSILVLNAGSSTLKIALFEPAPQGTFTEIATAQHPMTEDGAALARAIQSIHARSSTRAPVTPITAVGQRVVHGGTHLTESVLVDDAVTAEITRLTDLAPLHNPPALHAIAAVASALPGIPQVAVFDTAFYSRLSEVETVYPVPYGWYQDWGIRRFGFHGISHAFCAARASELLKRDIRTLRLITCHLGNGCSATATRGGVPVATTMGFTPLDGLMMGTRPGALDPGILLHVEKHHGLAEPDLSRILNHESGLKGISGVASDYREVESAAKSGHARARLALDLYADRVRKTIGALAVTLGGADALVFTAGVGENSAALRAAACEGLACLGLHLDPAKNAANTPDTDIATPQSPSRILILHTREELLIAGETARITTTR